MSTKERIYLHLLYAEIMTKIKMADCYICGKKDISKNEIGLTKKLMGKRNFRTKSKSLRMKDVNSFSKAGGIE